MKRKLALQNLEVKSFVTKEEKTVKGGTLHTRVNCPSDPCVGSYTCYTYGCGECTNTGNYC